MEIKWHKVDEKPHFDEKDFYAPISGKEHKWEDCYFTYWAYCHEFYPIEQLKNS